MKVQKSSFQHRAGYLVCACVLLVGSFCTALAENAPSRSDIPTAPNFSKNSFAPAQAQHESPIFRAIYQNDLSMLERYIGTALEQTDSGGYTPLLCAIELKREKMVDTLIEAGANLSVKVQKPRHTVMHIAAAFGTSRIIDRLVQSGIDVNVKNDLGVSPIYFAATKNNIEAIDALIKHGADIHFKLESGESPLHFACEYGLASAIRLIEAGADMEAQNLEGITPFLAACQSGSCKLIDELINLGADLEHKNNEGLGALFYAVGSNNPDAIKLLLKRGLCIENEGALMAHAVICSCKKSIQFLIEVGVNVDAKEKGLTPLHRVAHRCNVDLAQLLIKLGADPMARDNNGNTPLHFAFDIGLSKEGSGLNTQRIEELSVMLIEAGADPDAKNMQGWTPRDIVTFMYQNSGVRSASIDKAISKVKALEKLKSDAD